MSNRSQQAPTAGAISVVMLMIVLAIPGIVVSSVMRRDALSGSGLPIAVIVGAVLVLLIAALCSAVLSVSRLSTPPRIMPRRSRRRRQAADRM